MSEEERDILKLYQERLAEFKRDCEALGIKEVKVSASLGKWMSTIEESKPCPNCREYIFHGDGQCPYCGAVNPD